MLSELCRELRNWFDRDQPKFKGTFEIVNGKLISVEFIRAIQNNQYFRISGSVFNDGVYQYTPELELIDETFKGSVWLMAIPKEVIDLSNDIDNWKIKYLADDSELMSPFQSESFGGYSYSKASSGSTSNSSIPTWQSIFASRLNQWRKI